MLVDSKFVGKSRVPQTVTTYVRRETHMPTDPVWTRLAAYLYLTFVEWRLDPEFYARTREESDCPFGLTYGVTELFVHYALIVAFWPLALWHWAMLWCEDLVLWREERRAQGNYPFPCDVTRPADRYAYR